MQRVQNLAAITGIALLVTGILIRFVTPNTELSLHWRGTGYGFAWETPCYGIAALFILSAFVYSIRYIPFDKTVAQWHLWLSLGCVVLYASGQVIFARMVGGTTTQLGVPGTALAILFLLSFPIFLVTQLLFAVELVRALARMHAA